MHHLGLNYCQQAPKTLLCSSGAFTLIREGVQCLRLNHALSDVYIVGVPFWHPLTQLDKTPIIDTKEFFGKGLEYTNQVRHYA